MLDETFQSREAEHILGLPRATLLWNAERLPVTRHGRAGKARMWKTKDICVIHLATRFAERGLTPAAAVDMATAVEPHFRTIVIEEETEGAVYFLIALLTPDEIGRHESIITKDPGEALAFVERGGAAVFNITSMIREALTLVLAHIKSREAKNA